MLHFLLNDTVIETDQPPGAILLDFLRDRQGLTGAKPACREGDCGSCMVLLGEWGGEALRYQSVNACLLPLGEVNGRHVVTVEGINGAELTPIQQALVESGAIQCGYCTPGLVMALTGQFLACTTPTVDAAIESVAGNLCRCAAYAGIRRAIAGLCSTLSPPLATSEQQLEKLIELGVVPPYFQSIPERLRQLPIPQARGEQGGILVGGGTDLFVREAESLAHQPLRFLSGERALRGVWVEGSRCHIGAETTMEDLRGDPGLRAHFPGMTGDFRLICSAPVRHRATLAGNLVNASPSADLAIYFLAHDATLALKRSHQLREVPLRAFYRACKQVDLQPGERIEWMSFDLPGKPTVFSFEKVGKRAHLDIAAVNSALRLEVMGEVIERGWLSAGGVAPTPLFLDKTSRFLTGQPLTATTVGEAARLAQTEIAPISDVRGSAEYKRQLLRQLIHAHFLKLFPQHLSRETRQ